MTIIEKMLLEVCLDERVTDGMFDIQNNSHMDALHDYLIKKGITKEHANNFHNLVMEKGKFPERQAFNIHTGRLDTFPTPEYKAKAIARGTHTEKDPKLSQSTVFGGGQAAPNAPTPPAAQPGAQPVQGQQQPASPPGQIPPTGTTPPATEPQVPPQAPQMHIPAVTPQIQQPVSAPAPKQPEVKKSPQEVEAEKEAIKQMLNKTTTLPTAPGTGLAEELKKITKIAIEMNLTEAVKFLTNHI